MNHKAIRNANLRVSYSDIRHMCGDIPNWKVAAIEAIAREQADVEIAVAWADRLDDTREHPLEGAAAQIFDILEAGEEEEDRR